MTLTGTPSTKSLCAIWISSVSGLIPIAFLFTFLLTRNKPRFCLGERRFGVLKYQVTRKARREFPLLVITKDKYQTCYFHVASHEDLYKVCFNTLKERLKEGWYGDPTAPTDTAALRKEAGELGTAIDEGKFPESMLPDAKRVYQRLRREIADIDNEAAFYARVGAALKDQSGEDALDCLMDRADHEYEWIALEQYTSTDK